jgi:hypothetical protein
MKRLLFLMLLFAVYLRGNAQSVQEQQQIQVPLLKFFDAMAAQQPDALKAEITRDFILLEQGKIWNTDSLTGSMARYKGLDIKRINHLEFVKTERIDDISLVSYYNTADLSYKGKQMSIKWLESAVLVRQKQGWKIKLLHSTEIKPPAATRK